MFSDKMDICKGCGALMLSAQYFFLDHIMPVINTTAAIAGAFIAFHGAYKIVRNHLEERRKRNARLYDEKIY